MSDISTTAQPEHSRQGRIDEILSFWFEEGGRGDPSLDSRMQRWFGSDSEFDERLETTFWEDVLRAGQGDYQSWVDEPRGRLAVILLLDQFRRNVFRHQAEAFSGDTKALELTLDGMQQGMDQELAPLHRAFFYMPLQHSESLRVQRLSIRAFGHLVESVSETLRETFETFAEFAQLHHDIVERFGRFPHRNNTLGRESTDEELQYLRDGGATFGQ